MGFQRKIPRGRIFFNFAKHFVKYLTTRFFGGFALVKLFHHEQILLLGVFPKLRQLRLNTQNLAFFVLARFISHDQVLWRFCSRKTLSPRTDFVAWRIPEAPSIAPQYSKLGVLRPRSIYISRPGSLAVLLS